MAVCVQLEELQTIGAIYEKEQFEFVKQNSGGFTGSFVAHPHMPDAMKCMLVRIRATNKSTELLPYRPRRFIKIDQTLYTEFEILYPPPITVNFNLPLGYPVSRSPSIDVVSAWLPYSLREVATAALNAFLEFRIGEPCLWECFNYLETELFTEILNLPTTDDGMPVFDAETLINQEALKYRFVSFLVASDAEASRSYFRKEMVECPVCAEPKAGEECLRLRTCYHIACYECLRTSFALHLSKGVMVGEFTCLLCKAGVSYNEVREFATPAQFGQYDENLLQRSLAAMPEVVACPRRGCGARAWAENESLARCPLCEHSFCPQCLRNYHPGNQCPTKDIYPYLEDESSGDDEEEDKERRLDNLQKMGPAERIQILKERRTQLAWELADEADDRKRLRLLLKLVRYRNDLLKEQVVAVKLIRSNIHRCPTCRMFVDKIDGCNSVYCPICMRHFAWGVYR